MTPLVSPFWSRGIVPLRIAACFPFFFLSRQLSKTWPAHLKSAAHPPTTQFLPPTRPPNFLRARFFCLLPHSHPRRSRFTPSLPYPHLFTSVSVRESYPFLLPLSEHESGSSPVYVDIPPRLLAQSPFPRFFALACDPRGYSVKPTTPPSSPHVQENGLPSFFQSCELFPSPSPDLKARDYRLEPLIQGLLSRSSTAA